ncbi:MAG: hydantoinase/oxoprolinase N-terminal domain-containing protein, partial [Pseudomonadota bacterium]|nr:hydantoinase/oxoprolinase N-terminal domain-containing protein [Pseudomonadota bacterium]
MVQGDATRTRLRLGIDTGGTYTDAALISDDQNLVASAKSLTTHSSLS